MPKWILLLLALALTVFIAAAVPAAQTLTLRAGQTATVGDARITLLKFSDNRCPPAAHCLLAGNVVAQVFVVRGSTSRLYPVFLTGRAVRTPAGLVRLKAATYRENGRTPQVLSFVLKQ